MSGQQLDRHPWCRDVQRDEAVRAVEDNRSGPLPTLEAVIAHPFAHSQGTCETGEGQSGLRTERVTLEVTHDYLSHASAMDWPYMVANYFYRNGESVRVVEEAHFDDPAQVVKHRFDAAIRERDTLRAERITQALTADRFASAVAEADTLKARVEELEAAPAASGAAGPEAAGTELPTQ